MPIEAEATLCSLFAGLPGRAIGFWQDGNTKIEETDIVDSTLDIAGRGRRSKDEQFDP